MATQGDRIEFKRGETAQILSYSIVGSSYWGNETNQSAWVPIDITNYTVILIIKLSVADADDLSVIVKENAPGAHSNPTNGQTLFTLSTTDTLKFPIARSAEQYNFEIWLQPGDGTSYPTQTGTLTVLAGLAQNITTITPT